MGEITMSDLEADKGKGLSEAAVNRLTGGLAAGLNLSQEDYESFDKTFRAEKKDGDGPQVMGIKVHHVPWWLQILYMIGVVGAMTWVVLMGVKKLGTRDREKEERKLQKEMGKKKA